MSITLSYKYARGFVSRRIKTYRKDVFICLTRNANGAHAYMPGLIATVSMLELLSGLYSGRLRSIGLKGILDYSGEFMDPTAYTEDRIAVLYELFRHKIAHLGHPYAVFDSHSVRNKHVLHNYERRWITWQINSSDYKPAIDIRKQSGTLRKDPPWPVHFTHKCFISLRRLSIDIRASAYGNSGYLAYLKTSQNAIKQFTKCMHSFYDTSGPAP